MTEVLYGVMDGPLGRAEVYQVSPQEAPWDRWLEVRFQGRSRIFGALGEAVPVALELVGKPYTCLARPTTAQPEAGGAHVVETVK